MPSFYNESRLSSAPVRHEPESPLEKSYSKLQVDFSSGLKSA
jgi:hypothetical protein